jgi:peroxiredoxin
MRQGLKTVGTCVLGMMAIGAAHSASIEHARQPVAERLRELAERSAEQAPPELLEAGRRGIDEVRRSGILETALAVGDVMPAWELVDARGATARSADMLAHGPLVITFYRGAWCPFCNLYLTSLDEWVPDFTSLGASVVAISGEPPERSLSVERANELEYLVLSDRNLRLARDFGLVYELPEVVDSAAREAGFDLAAYQGVPQAELPLAATYVIDTDGIIVYAFLDADHKLRAEHADVVAVIEKLRSR